MTMNSYELKIMIENGHFAYQNGSFPIIFKHDIAFYVLLEENQYLQGAELEKRVEQIWQEYQDFLKKNFPVKNWCEKYFPTLDKDKSTKMQDLIENGHEKSLVTFAQEVVELVQN